MPRVAGRIDQAKTEAILDAAMAIFSERGQLGCVEDIARRARVSKQTIYNHYGSKAELVRAIAARRAHQIAGHLDLPGAVEDPEGALAALGREALQGIAASAFRGLLRLAVISAAELPEVGTALYESGVRAGRARLARFLEIEHEAGRLDVPDAFQAAELFMGMLLGPYQLPNLLGVEKKLTEAEVDSVARECAARFVRAYAPKA